MLVTFIVSFFCIEVVGLLWSVQLILLRLSLKEGKMMSLRGCFLGRVRPLRSLAERVVFLLLQLCLVSWLLYSFILLLVYFGF